MQGHVYLSNWKQLFFDHIWLYDISSCSENYTKYVKLPQIFNIIQECKITPNMLTSAKYVNYL